MIISILNLKGGTGKTISALALATAAVAAVEDAVVLDADPQSSASLWALVAEDNGDPLPFPVESANIATVKMAAMKDRGVKGKWVFIDCPPSGNVADEAMSAADMVIIPTTPSPADLVKTFVTAETAIARRAFYAILLNRVNKNTLTLRSALSDFEQRKASYFAQTIPRREVLSSFFGNAFDPAELYGYAEVFAEMKEALDGR